MGPRTRRQRRFVFGEVAGLYDRVRPGYPAALFDDLVDLAGLATASRVLEVGAGTGRATRQLGRRGLEVTALEPSAPMAALARQRCDGLPGVRLVESTFESWSGASTSLDLVTAAQAWHWVRPGTGLRKAAGLLAEGGWLALFWNIPVDRGSPLEEDLDEVYRQVARGMVRHWGATPSPDGPDEWEVRLDGAPDFGEVLVREYPWRRVYATAEYVGLLRTHSAHRSLDEERREELLGRVAEVVERAGGRIQVTYACRLYAAPVRPASA